VYLLIKLFSGRAVCTALLCCKFKFWCFGDKSLIREQLKLAFLYFVLNTLWTDFLNSSLLLFPSYFVIVFGVIWNFYGCVFLFGIRCDDQDVIMYLTFAQLTVCGHVSPLHLQPVAELWGQQRLHSSSTSALVVPPTRLRTIGDRAFSVAAAKTWNSLPPEVTSSSRHSSLSTFKSKLKTHLFLLSFPDL